MNCIVLLYWYQVPITLAQWVEAEAVVPNKLFEILFILYIIYTVLKQSIEMLVGGGGRT